jgi:DNA polymerase elongation subunit (family B)
MRDCDIVLKGLQYMRDALTSVGADFAYTLASISTRWVRRSDVLEWMKFYEVNEITGKYEYSKKMLQADEFCLPAYFGGRVEVFKAGTFTRDLYYYDITSSYPWSMLHELPTYFRGFHPPPKKLAHALEHWGISEATIFIPEGTMDIPLLPIRHNGKLIFPEGHFKGRWTNLELKALWERGRRKGVKIKIHAQARFDELAFLKPFVDTFFNLRAKAKKDKDEFRSYTYKIALNSLYGKLVESIERESVVYGKKMVDEAIKEHGRNALKMTSTPGIYFISSETLGPFRHVAAGSYVTARSRLRLLEGMEICRRAGGHIYYCDTDSIITDKEIKAFDTPVKLGGFELEHKFKEAEFICPKVYIALDYENNAMYRVKGMPIKGLNAEESQLRWASYTAGLNPDAQEYLDSQNLSEERMQEISSKEGLAGFKTDLSKGTIKPRMQLLQRQLRNQDSKRIHSNGTSKPLFIENMEDLSNGTQ